MGLTKVISCSIPPQWYQTCINEQRKGNVEFKFSNVWRRGFIALINKSSDDKLKQEHEQLKKQLDFYMRRMHQLSDEIASIRAEKGK